MIKMSASLIAILIIAILIFMAFVDENDVEPKITDDVGVIATDILYPLFESDKPATEEEKEKAKEDEEALQIGKLYGELMCMMSDPQFWEEFFDEMFDGRQSEQDRMAEDAKMNAFYKSNGYDSEDMAKTHLDKYWGHENFKTAVRSRIARSGTCSSRVKQAGVNLEEHLASPKPDFE